MDYRFTLDARIDLLSAAAFYDSQREGLGAEFTIDVGVAIARVLDAPKRWAEVEPGVRKYNLNRFPYGIIYRQPHSQMVEIVAVFHLKRRPGSWKDPR